MYVFADTGGERPLSANLETNHGAPAAGVKRIIRFETATKSDNVVGEIPFAIELLTLSSREDTIEKSIVPSPAASPLRQGGGDDGKR